MRSERINNVRDYIYINKTVTWDDLCNKFNVSKNTMRRDVDELVASNDVKKIYGGVTVEGITPTVSFAERNISNLSQKKDIAKKAASLVNNDEIIFIDSGTTTLHMIEHIKNLDNLTILTNSIEVIFKCIPYPNINVISLSGLLNRETLSFTGSSAAQVLNQYNISKAFMAATGISVNSGATNSSQLETDIKRTALLKSQHKYLLVDHSKFEVISLMTFSDFSDIDAIITNKLPPMELEATIRKNKCEIILSS